MTAPRYCLLLVKQSEQEQTKSLTRGKYDESANSQLDRCHMMRKLLLYAKPVIRILRSETNKIGTIAVDQE